MQHGATKAENEKRKKKEMKKKKKRNRNLLVWIEINQKERTVHRNESISQCRTVVKYVQVNGNYIKQYAKILLNIDDKSHDL